MTYAVSTSASLTQSQASFAELVLALRAVELRSPLGMHMRDFRPPPGVQRTMASTGSAGYAPASGRMPATSYSYTLDWVLEV